METLEIQEQKRENASHYKKLAEVLLGVVPQVLDAKDGKVYNKKFIADLNAKADELFGTFTIHGNNRPRFIFTDMGEHSSADKDENGNNYYKRKIELRNYELTCHSTYQNKYASTSFVIYVKLDEKRNTRVCKEMSDKAFNSCWYLPAYKDCVTSLLQEAGELEKCTSEKINECVEALRAISLNIKETFKGLERRGDVRPQPNVEYDYRNIVGMNEALVLLKIELARDKDFQPLSELLWSLKYAK